MQQDAWTSHLLHLQFIADPLLMAHESFPENGVNSCPDPSAIVAKFLTIIMLWVPWEENQQGSAEDRPAQSVPTTARANIPFPVGSNTRSPQ